MLAAPALLVGSSAPAGASVPDPERNASAITGWHWQKLESFRSLRAKYRERDERLIDIEVRKQDPVRFSAVLVKNEGDYRRGWGWGARGTKSSIKKKLKAKDGRLIDIEPYMYRGERVFAYLWVKNTGKLAKKWDWGIGSSKYVKAEAKRRKMKLVDLDPAVLGGKTLYAYIAVRQDEKTYPYFGLRFGQIQAKAEKRNARLIDLERRRNGKYVAILQAKPAHYSRHLSGFSHSRLNNFTASNGIRLTHLYSYGKGKKRRYGAIGIDNVDQESGRLRGMALEAFGDDYFGVYVKRVKGPVLVGLAHRHPYQPLSTVKLVPHLYAMDQVDRGIIPSLQTELSWTSPAGNPEEYYCERVNTGPKQTYSEPLEELLRKLLEDSNNRAYETLVVNFTPEAINERMTQMGLPDTRVFPGCKQAEGVNDSWDSRTTLSDIGWLFEGVHTDVLLYRKSSTKQDFFDLVHEEPNHLYRSSFREVVADEAGPQKSNIVDQFVASIVIKGKPGGSPCWGDYNHGVCDDTRVGRTWSDFVRLPTYIRVGGARVRSYNSHVGGVFVEGLHVGSCNPPEGTDTSSSKCQKFAKRYVKNFFRVNAERYRLGIREALKSWPSN